jgi:hypothetical protein
MRGSSSRFDLSEDSGTIPNLEAILPGMLAFIVGGQGVHGMSSYFLF